MQIFALQQVMKSRAVQPDASS